MDNEFTSQELRTPMQSARNRALSLETGYSPYRQGISNASHPDNTFAYSLGAGLRSLAKSGPGRFVGGVAATPFNHGSFLGGAAGLAGGSALGYGLGHLLNYFGDDEDASRPGWGALLGALAGAGGGALLGAMRQKKAGLLSSIADDRTYVRWRVTQDSDLSMREKQSLLSAVSQLSEGDLADLAGVLRTAIGASVGAIVAKFLMGAGVGGMLLGALTGGFAANRMAGPSILGTEQHSGKTDAYGNAYTF